MSIFLEIIVNLFGYSEPVALLYGEKVLVEEPDESWRVFCNEFELEYTNYFSEYEL